jgi:hypothetical protein
VDKEHSSTEAGCAEGNQAVRLSSIQKACLRFCIALLDQRITCREYDSPLVCAQYPPILSAMIKVARFMVGQQGLELSDLELPGLELADPIEDSSDKLDSAYKRDPSRQLQHPKGCLQLVQQMMDKFMVRGSHGPMQWMLDLRTYGLSPYEHPQLCPRGPWLSDADWLQP